MRQGWCADTANVPRKRSSSAGFFCRVTCARISEIGSCYSTGVDVLEPSFSCRGLAYTSRQAPNRLSSRSPTRKSEGKQSLHLELQQHGGITSRSNPVAVRRANGCTDRSSRIVSCCGRHLVSSRQRKSCKERWNRCCRDMLLSCSGEVSGAASSKLIWREEGGRSNTSGS